jgi:hypothetical protein
MMKDLWDLLDQNGMYGVLRKIDDSRFEIALSELPFEDHYILVLDRKSLEILRDAIDSEFE